MTVDLDDDRMRLLKSRLAFANGGEVVLPAAFILAMLREVEEAREARRAFDAYRASVDSFLGRRSTDHGEVGP